MRILCCAIIWLALSQQAVAYTQDNFDLLKSDPSIAKALDSLENRTPVSSGTGPNQDNWDLLKSDPELAKADLRNRTPVASSTGPNQDLGWAANIGPDGVLVFTMAVFMAVTLLPYFKNRARGKLQSASGISRTRYEGILLEQGKPKWWVVFGLFFVLVRGCADLYVGVSSDNALNLLFGLFGIGCALMPFIGKYRARFFLVAGCWMMVRGLLNLFLFISMTDGLGEYIATMPIGGLPNLIISYVLPITIGICFLKLHRASSSLAGR